MDSQAQTVLVIAHPGHELRVHGWVERERPLVLVVTDGSGLEGRSRLAATARLLARLGARPGTVFGRLSDSALYAALLAGDHALFTGLADEIADTLVRTGATQVAGDALEGYNPSHDVCRMLLDTAVSRAEARTGRAIANNAIPLAGAPDSEVTGGVVLFLDDAELERKRAAALSYEEMRSEVEPALARHGLEAYRREVLVPIRPFDWTPAEQPPFYERHGEGRVAAGLYRRVIRYREHLAPLGDALAIAHACAP
jgi:hypothetical protein